ncbi:SpoIIE family protein phosphatase [Spirochaetota bacterium]
MNKKIMVIDDDESIRKLMGRVLDRAGYDVSDASNGMEALEKLDKTNVDLIILDMNMPKMNGLQFLKHVRDKNITTVPVLMVSGSSDTDLRIKSYKLGVYDFIKKPEMAEVLLKRIENGLKIGEMIIFNEFIKIELLMARKLQKYLFPDPVFKTENVDIFAWSKLLSDIGGDLYDYIEFRDGRIILCVADVSGHSISAALFTAIVKMIFRNAIKVTQDPAEVMGIMNRELSENLPVESFVTMFCGIINPGELTIEYANAGHPKPLCICNNKVVELEGNDPFLGPIQNAKFCNFKKKLKPGESILIFTDGISDLSNRDDVPVGTEMLLKTMRSEGPSAYEKFMDIQKNILKGDFSIIDDCTLMLVNFK